MKNTTDKTTELIKLFNGNYHLKWSAKCSMKKQNFVEYYDTEQKKWRTTKRFSLLKVPYNEIYNGTNMNMTWFHVCKLAEKYSKTLGVDLAYTMVAGIIAEDFFNCHYKIYEIIKDIIPPNFNERFFNSLTCNTMLMSVGYITLDTVAIDKNLASLDDDYDDDEATYKGKECSMKDYIDKRYGKPYSKIMNLLMKEM